MTCKLSVNVNAIAYLRNRRNLPWPDVEELGRIALASGAAGLTVHPRPDERHIRHADVPVLRRLIAEEFPAAEFNIEGYPDERFLKLVEEHKPQQVTLVPDDPAQGTSDHGWDIPRNSALLSDVLTRLQGQGMRVSLFIDADRAMVDWAKEIGADRVELYTGPYGGALESQAAKAELAKLLLAGRRAADVGIGLNAGHDLTVANLPPLVQALPNLQEVSIGHALIGEAMIYGMAEAVRRFRQAIGDV